MSDKKHHDKKHKHHEHVNKYADKAKHPQVAPVDVVTSKKHGEFSTHGDKPYSDKHEFDRKEDKKHDDKS